MAIDIYEHFDFDINHLRVANEIYCPATDKWNKCSEDLWTCLLEMSRSWNIVRRYRLQTHDGKNLKTAAVYQKMLDNHAKIKRIMQPFANEFCISYKGYSLN